MYFITLDLIRELPKWDSWN